MLASLAHRFDSLLSGFCGLLLLVLAAVARVALGAGARSIVVLARAGGLRLLARLGGRRCGGGRRRRRLLLRAGGDDKKDQCDAHAPTVSVEREVEALEPVIVDLDDDRVLLIRRERFDRVLLLLDGFCLRFDRAGDLARVFTRDGRLRAEWRAASTSHPCRRYAGHRRRATCHADNWLLT